MAKSAAITTGALVKTCRVSTSFRMPWTPVEPQRAQRYIENGWMLSLKYEGYVVVVLHLLPISSYFYGCVWPFFLEDGKLWPSLGSKIQQRWGSLSSHLCLVQTLCNTHTTIPINTRIQVPDSPGGNIESGLLYPILVSNRATQSRR